MDPTFSVVIPVHNKREHVLSALYSVEGQTYADYEVLVVDDASTDGSLVDLPGFDIPSLTILHREAPGLGGYAARNLAIQHARGRYIAFLDADDLWSPDHLAVGAALIRCYPDAVLCLAGFEEVLGLHLKRISHSCTEMIDAAQFLERYARSDCLHTNSIFAKKSAVLHVGGFPEQGVKRAGDHLLWLRLVCLGYPIALSHSVTSRYRRDHSSVVANPDSITGCHPVAAEVHRLHADQSCLPEGWGTIQLGQLRKLSNRKALFWMLQAKRTARFSLAQLSSLYILDLRPHEIVKLIILLCLPGRLWAFLVGMREEWRQRRARLSASWHSRSF